jgi:serine/threonine-protein kinase SRPK3
MHRLVLKAQKNKNYEPEDSDDSLTSDDENEVSEGFVGRIFGNSYLCIKYLGKGTFSKVWMVCNLKNGDLFAMKTQLPEFIEDTEHEIGILNKINHIYNKDSRVGKLYESFKESFYGETYYCLIMELLGESISNIYDVFEDDLIPLDVIRRILKDLLLGVNEFHIKRIIHTDLKMENILITQLGRSKRELIKWFEGLNSQEFIENRINQNLPENFSELNKVKKKSVKRKVRDRAFRSFSNYFLDELNKYNQIETDYEEYTREDLDRVNVKIVDFGNAEVEGDLNQEVISLRIYRPPENLMTSYYNTKTDIWTLGCIAYEFFTGDPLFEIKRLRNSIERDRCHISEMFKYLGKMPKSLCINCEFSKDLFDHKGRILKNRDIEEEDIKEILKVLEYSEDDCFLIESLLRDFLEYDVRIRKGGSQILNHLFFKNLAKLN